MGASLGGIGCRSGSIEVLRRAGYACGDDAVRRLTLWRWGGYSDDEDGRPRSVRPAILSHLRVG